MCALNLGHFEMEDFDWFAQTGVIDALEGGNSLIRTCWGQENTAFKILPSLEKNLPVANLLWQTFSSLACNIVASIAKNES